MIDARILRQREREAWRCYEYERDYYDMWEEEVQRAIFADNLTASAEARTMRDEAEMAMHEARRRWRAAERELDAVIEAMYA